MEQTDRHFRVHAGLAGAALVALTVSFTAARAADLPRIPAGNGLLLPKAVTDDKSQYTLFNPTPDRLLRDFGTDRPDNTESPFTVDAGRFQVETNLFGYTRSRPDDSGAVTTSTDLAETNFRLGLTSNAELSVIFKPYGVQTVRPGDPTMPRVRSSGVGDLTIRTKINFWGNDSFEQPGATAFGLLPYVSLPVDRGNGISSDAIQGGLILPFAIKLPQDFALGLNGGVNAVRNDAGPGYHAEYLASASLSHDWSENFTTYYEVASTLATRNPLGDVVTFDTGFSYKIAKNVQIDAGVNIGLTRAADRYNPFVGISKRF